MVRADGGARYRKKGKMQCKRCGEECDKAGRDAAGNLFCYDCCGELDREQMDRDGKITLYLCNGEVTNFPGTLRFPVQERRAGRHNIAGLRIDVWFSDHEGRPWWGRSYGENTSLVHCRRLKRVSE